MPTGYTAGIIDGKIKTFEDFAKQCIRAFGAAVHMRDEDFDKEFEPATPSDYHINALQKVLKQKQELLTSSDEDLLKQEKDRLNELIEYHNASIKKDKENLLLLNKFLREANEFQPPTEEHVEIKKFMIDQLQKTIKHDTNSTYNFKGLVEAEEEIKYLDASKIREEKLKSYETDIAYHKEKYKEDKLRCTERNLWAEQYFQAIKSNENTH